MRSSSRRKESTQSEWTCRRLRSKPRESTTLPSLELLRTSRCTLLPPLSLSLVHDVDLMYPRHFDSQAADFFAFPLDNSFSLAYDFTFFCAIPPTWRQKWGDRYAEVVRKGGVLITLQYPIGEKLFSSSFVLWAYG